MERDTKLFNISSKNPLVRRGRRRDELATSASPAAARVCFERNSSNVDSDCPALGPSGADSIPALASLNCQLSQVIPIGPHPYI